jgi:hypothetical protein
LFLRSLLDASEQAAIRERRSTSASPLRAVTFTTTRDGQLARITIVNARRLLERDSTVAIAVPHQCTDVHTSALGVAPLAT